MLDSAATLDILQRFGIAMGLGLLLGFEREYSHNESKPSAAGLRTYAVMGLLGCAAALLAAETSPLVLATAFLGLSAVVLTSYVLVWRTIGRQGGLGITSEVEALLVFVLGALVYHGFTTVCVVVTGATAVLLSAKRPMHGFVRGLSAEDMVAVAKFAVVSLVILPILPNDNFGPYGAFNPYRTWLMVVLIGAIGFLGYFLTRTIGVQRGLVLSGLVGGLASSTAVTLASAQRSRSLPLPLPLALGVVLACLIMLPRVAVEVAAVHAALLTRLAWPLLAMLLTTLVYAWWLYRRAHAPAEPNGDSDEAEHAATQADYTNPFELKSALQFAALYALVNGVVVWAGQTHLGSSGLYVVSFLSGLAQVDAITLSLAQQASEGLPGAVAARGIVLGLVANTLLKAALALALGDRAFGRLVLQGLLLVAAVGVAVVFAVG